MTPAAPQGPLSKLGFAVSLVGVCFLPLCAVGGLLAFIDRWRQGGAPTRGFDYRSWVLRLNGVSLVLTLLLVPSAPMLLAERQRAKQAECREVLTGLHAHAAEVLAGTLTLEALAATVPAVRRQPYTYVLSPTVLVPPTHDAPPPEAFAPQLARTLSLASPGLSGTCPDCHLTLACVGNTDGDDELDILSVSTAPRWESGLLPVDPGHVALNQKDFGARDEIVTTFAPRD